ncbi:MAG: sulfotransferase [Proteobacteria bacterium]|nr:sulfotransferase [Pseudomonadota bacterium]HQR04909.1 sulfotransferase [Rhodocyclaceae bacterium]
MLIPPRLPLPLRTFNTLGSAARALGIYRNRLAPERLIAAAQQQTLLTDFGAGPFLGEMEILVDALEREARLSSLGRILARDYLLKSLKTQLQIQDWFNRHPEIADQPIVAPVFIIGMPRTGTSILHELMALDDHNRVPQSWEVNAPCPPPESARYTSDPRIAEMEKQYRGLDALLPAIRLMHRQGSQLPQECVAITAHVFAGMMLPTLYHIPSYTRWLHHEADMAPYYRFHRRFLQLLQWRNPRQRWVLKSPGHQWSLAALVTEYPDARLIQTHRDPLKVLSSVTRLVTAMRCLASDHVDPRAVAREWAAYHAEALDSSWRVRESGALAGHTLIDTRFQDFMTDQAGTVRGIYDRLGLPWPAELDSAIRRYVADHPAGAHGGPGHRFEDLGLDATTERTRVAGYQNYFAVPSEP